ncbi:MAG: glutaredoxin family protein [Micrococcus sp.]|nr:glutaredoxin family protein [Micrococcus sp.]
MTITHLQSRIDARDGTAVTVYTTPGCQTCPGVIRNIRDRGYEPTIVDITTDDAAYGYVTRTLGYQEVPVVVVSGPEFEDHWSGRRPDKVIEFLPKVAAA